MKCRILFLGPFLRNSPAALTIVSWSCLKIQVLGFSSFKTLFFFKKKNCFHYSSLCLCVLFACECKCLEGQKWVSDPWGWGARPSKRLTGCQKLNSSPQQE